MGLARNSELREIYYSYELGSQNGKMLFSQPIKLYAQVADVTSSVTRENVGLLEEYDRYIYLPFFGKARYLNEQSLLWVDVEPNTDLSNSDYKIKRLGDVVNGCITLYCNANTSNTKSLYYEYEGVIYQVKVPFDSKTLIAVVPYNKFFPIEEGTKVWTTKPTNSSSTENLLELVKRESRLKSLKYQFKKVSE